MHNGQTFIDGHLHIYHLTGFDRMMDIAHKSGLDAMNFLGITQYDKQYMGQNALGMLFKGRNPGKWSPRHPYGVYFFAGLHHDLPGGGDSDHDLAAQARRLAATGCDGFKILESKPNCYKRVGKPLDGPAFAPLFDYAQASGKPILWHAVDPDICWDAARCPQWFKDSGYYYDSTFPTEKQLRGEVANVLRNFPKLKVIFAHFYFLSQNIDVARRFLDDHPGANLDLTPGDEMYTGFSTDTAAWRKFFTTYQDRIVFGTDNTDDTSTAQMGELSMGANNVARILRFLETDDTITSFSGGPVHGLSLAPEVVAKIIGGNYRRIVAAAPMPLDLNLCLDYCHWLLPFAKRSEASAAILPEFEQTVDGLQRL